MRLTVLLLFTPALLVNATPAFSQDGPTGFVAWTLDCHLNDGFTVSDIVTAARALPRDGNSPDLVLVRDAALASPEYRDNWDFQVAALYPSYQEMGTRRAARLRSPVVSDQVSPADMSTCGTAAVYERYNVRTGDAPLSTTTTMVTRLCEVTNTTRAAAFNRISEIADNYAAEGIDLSVSMDIPGVGGPLDLSDSRFMIRVFGPHIPQMLDLRRMGFRAGGGLGDSGLSCNRWSGWRSHTVHNVLN